MTARYVKVLWWALVVLVVTLAPRVSAAGSVPPFIRQWGTLGTANGQFQRPSAVAVGLAGVYVGDLFGHRVQLFDSTGQFVSSFGSQMIAETVSSIGIGPDGSIYVVDQDDNAVEHFSPSGSYLGGWGDFGSADGEFHTPYGVAVDALGFVYVTDGGNHRVQKFTASGTFVKKWGVQGSSGNGSFETPYGIVVTGNGTIVVADYSTSIIQLFTSEGVWVSQWGSPGSGSDGLLLGCASLARDTYDHIYVADSGNNQIQVFNLTGAFLQRWGSLGTNPGQFDRPLGLAVDSEGNIFVADNFNNRVQEFGTTPTAAQGTTWGFIKGKYR